MVSVLGQLKAVARVAMYLVLAYFAISLWQDPAGAAQATLDFVKGIGNLFATLIDKLVAFVRSLIG
jgi:hypothetical protein